MKKILIAHALDGYIEKEKSILNRSSFEIISAHTGEEALRIHKKEKVDLIITDLELPELSGDLLCSLIRNDDELKNVSIIIIGNNTPADRKRFELSKANCFLTMPVRPVELLEKVSNLLDIPERKGYRVLLKVSVSGQLKNDSFFCSSHDISSTGLLIETDKVFSKGDIISCSFFLPNVERIITDAEVMRIIDNREGIFMYGVRFVNLTQDQQSAIAAFIDRRSGRR